METTGTVMLVDDTLAVLRYYEQEINATQDLTVVAVANSGAAAVKEYGQLYRRGEPPEIVVQTLFLLDITGLEVMVQVQQIHAAARFIFVSRYWNPTNLRQVLDAGAVGALAMNWTEDLLVEKVRAAISGEDVFDPLTSKIRRENQTMALTDRELEVAHLMCRPDKEIARLLSMSLRRVNQHITSIKRKVSCDDRREAIVILHKMGLFSVITFVISSMYESVEPVLRMAA